MIVELRARSRPYTDLSMGQQYVVLGIEADDLRVVSNAGKPHLYPRSIFRVTDATRPRSWLVEKGEDGEEYAYPEPLNAIGFFEDFFEQRPHAVSAFWRWWNDSESQRTRRTSRQRSTSPAPSRLKRAAS